MKRIASFVPVIPFLLVAFMVSLTACNVPPQKKMPETPSIMRQVGLRTTPAGQTGRTNFLLSYGLKTDINAMWNIQGYENTNLVLDKPVVMATECDPTQIQYQFTWVLTDNNWHDLEAPVVLGTDVTKSPIALETSGLFDLRVHLTNISTCRKISFAFNVFEVPGYTPASDPLQVSTDGSVQVNQLQPRAAYITTSTHMYVLPTSTQAQTFAIIDPAQLPQSAAIAPCTYAPQFTLQQTDSKGGVTTAPVANNTFTTDPTKTTNALIVSVQKGAQCQNQPYAFGVKLLSTADVPAPAPTTDGSVAPSANAAASLPAAPAPAPGDTAPQPQSQTRASETSTPAASPSPSPTA